MTGHFGRSALLSLVLAVTSISTWAGDTVYRWKDSGGNTVHSDRQPPVGTEYDTISTKSNFSHKMDEGTQAPSTGSAPGTTDSAPDQESVAPPQTIEKNPQLCAAAKQNLETLSIRGRIRVMGDDGEYTYLDEEQKEVERNKASAIIKMHCED